MLDEASELVRHRVLHRVNPRSLDALTVSGHVVPLDFRYWFVTHGAGALDLSNGEIGCPSPETILHHESGGRLYGSRDPVGVRTRLALGWNGAPALRAIDGTIMDPDGCAPVIMTAEYSNQVETVLASSWPMYVVRQLLEHAREMAARHEVGAALKRLASLEFRDVDVGLDDATARALAHNEKRVEAGSEEAEEFAQAGLDSLEDVLTTMADKLDAENVRQVVAPSLERIEDAMRYVEREFATGETLPDAWYRLMAVPKPGELDTYYALLDHPYHRVRYNVAFALCMYHRSVEWFGIRANLQNHQGSWWFPLDLTPRRLRSFTATSKDTRVVDRITDWFSPRTESEERETLSD